jgi:hypothetical protein
MIIKDVTYFPTILLGAPMKPEKSDRFTGNKNRSRWFFSYQLSVFNPKTNSPFVDSKVFSGFTHPQEFLVGKVGGFI